MSRKKIKLIMKKVVFTLFLLLNTLNVFSQRNIKIEYDKFTDLVVFKEVKVQNGKRLEVIFPKVPKIAKGDIVTLKIINLNTFLYRADILQKGTYTEVTGSSKLPGFLGTILGGLSPIGGVLSSFDDISTIFNSRGENAPSVEQTIVLTEVQNRLEKLQLEIENFNNAISEIDQAIIILYSENLPVGEEKIKLISRLEEVSSKISEPFSGFDQNLISIQDLMLKSNFSNEEINQLLTEYYLTNNSITEAMNSSSGILLTKEGLNSLISELKSASFSYEEKFQFDDLLLDGAKSLSLEEGEIGLSGLNYEILFFDLKAKSETHTNIFDASNQGKLVRYFYSGIFTNSKGEIVDSPCAECKPLVKAEGHLVNTAYVPRYIDGLYQVNDDDEIIPFNLNNDAIGTWYFYKESGEIDHIDYAPEFNKTNSTQLTEDPLSEFETTPKTEIPDFTKTIEIPVKGAVRPSWSSGIYFVNSFSQRKTYFYEANNFGDSIVIRSKKDNSLPICIGTQVAFNFASNKKLIPSAVIGASVAIVGDKNMNFLVGGGLKFRSFQFLSLTGGLSFVQTSSLDKSFIVNNTYTIDTVYDKDVSVKKFKLGYYFGININF